MWCLSIGGQMILSIVIPVYNSETSIRLLYDQLKASIDVSYEIIFVNDNSTDGSLKVLSSLDAIVLSMDKNVGQQEAIAKGIEIAQGHYIVTMDDDLQHAPEDVMRLYHKINEGYDLVYGVSDEHDHTYRRLGSKLTGLFFKLRYPRYKNIKVSSFRIFKSTLSLNVIDCPYSFVYISAIMLRESIDIGQLIVQKRKRAFGKSGYSLKSLVVLFCKLAIYYGHLPEWIKPKRNRDENFNIRSGQLPAQRH